MNSVETFYPARITVEKPVSEEVLPCKGHQFYILFCPLSFLGPVPLRLLPMVPLQRRLLCPSCLDPCDKKHRALTFIVAPTFSLQEFRDVIPNTSF